MAPLLAKSLATGSNATIFAYGQTGSGKAVGWNTVSRVGWGSAAVVTVRWPRWTGKTHAIDGCGAGAAAGLVPRLLADLFEAGGGDGQRVASVEMSFCQLYDDNLTDLLGPSPGMRVDTRPAASRRAAGTSTGSGSGSGSGGSGSDCGHAIEFANATTVAATGQTGRVELLAAFRAGAAHRATGPTFLLTIARHSARWRAQGLLCLLRGIRCPLDTSPPAA